MVEAAKLVRSDVRAAQRKIVLEGPHLLREVLGSGLVPNTVFVLERVEGERAAAAGSDVLTVSQRVMAKLATTRHPRGPITVAPMPDMAPRPKGSSLVLWGISDPGNVGTSIRSAVAFGVSVVVGPGCADLWNPKVLRAAAGAHFRGTVVAAPELGLDQLEAWGMRTVAARTSGGRRIDDVLGGDVAVLIGGEGSGLPQEVLDGVGDAVTIPMTAGSESLNAGVTASLLAYELGRAVRGEPEITGD